MGYPYNRPDPPSQLYVAGSSAELDRVADFVARARRMGWSITLDWVEVVRGNGGVANPTDVPTDQLRAWAQADLDAVDACDVLVLLAPGEGAARGAFAELGFALARGKHIVAVSSPTCPSIFLGMANTIVASDLDALVELGRLGRGDA